VKRCRGSRSNSPGEDHSSYIRGGWPVRRTGAAGIAVRGLNDYRVTPDDEALRDPLAPALVIGFDNVTTRQIREGIGVFGQLVAAATAG